MSDAPATIEYVLAPINSDTGEIEVEADPHIVHVKVCDLEDRITLVVLAPDVPLEACEDIAERVGAAAAAHSSERAYIVVRADLNRFRAVRLIRRDYWDDLFGEPK